LQVRSDVFEPVSANQEFAAVKAASRVVVAGV
jgi:hypothetical protein